MEQGPQNELLCASQPVAWHERNGGERNLKSQREKKERKNERKKVKMWIPNLDEDRGEDKKGRE